MRKECFSLRQFIARSACANYERIASFGILEDRNTLEKRAVAEEALKLQGVIAGDEDAQEKMEKFIRSHLKREWYLADIQFESQIMEEVFFQKRLAAAYEGINRKEVNITFEVPLSANRFPLGHLRGMAHVVLEEDDGCIKVLTFRNGVSPYSRSARKPENRPEYAAENLMMYLGLCPIYGRNMKVELVYMKHEKDGIQQPFDAKRQIMPADFHDMEISVIQKRLEKILTYHIKKRQSENDCEKCKYITLCKKEKRKDKEEEIGKIKAVTLKFTQSQQNVVGFDRGACAVYAVPGAGKTTTLVYRLCRLLKEGIDPGKILFVTFTNKAAQEIHDRVMPIIGKSEEAELPDIYTYNGLGWQIIRDHPEICGKRKLLSPIDEKLLLLKCINDSPKLTGYKYNYINGRFGLLNQLKKAFLDLESNEERATEELYRTGHDAEQVKSMYAKLLHKIEEEGFITYDEQITLANRILLENPEVLKQYASRWEYIMADEFQDSSQDNVDLLYQIARAGESNIVVVGDADQSIYEWRNGSPKHLLQFGENFRGAKKILMQDNFRSSDKILEASNMLIAQNINRIEISMQPHKSGSVRPYRLRGANINSIPMILQMLREKRFSYGDIAILSRKNAPLEKCKQILEMNGIGCVSPSDNLVKDSFFHLTGDLLKIFEDLRSDMAFYRVFQALGCTLPPKEDKSVSFYDNLIGSSSKSLKPMDINNMESVLTYAVADQDRPGSELFQAASTVFKLLMAMKACKPEKYLDMVADVFGYSTGDPAYRALLTVVEQHEPMETLDDLRNHMNFMEQLGDETPVEYSVEPEKVNLMTAHGSKGKEFPAVIVLQCEDFRAVEEERRLMYVAMTRAKKVLFLLESPFETCELFDSIDSLLQTMSMTT